MTYNLFRSALWLGILALALSTISLFAVKHRVQELNRQLHMVNRGIISEKENIHVLKAEYAYLTQPQVIQKLATKHLVLQPTQPQQILKYKPGGANGTNS